MIAQNGHDMSDKENLSQDDLLDLPTFNVLDPEKPSSQDSDSDDCDVIPEEPLAPSGTPTPPLTPPHTSPAAVIVPDKGPVDLVKNAGAISRPITPDCDIIDDPLTKIVAPVQAAEMFNILSLTEEQEKELIPADKMELFEVVLKFKRLLALRMPEEITTYFFQQYVPDNLKMFSLSDLSDPLNKFNADQLNQCLTDFLNEFQDKKTVNPLYLRFQSLIVDLKTKKKLVAAAKLAKEAATAKLAKEAVAKEVADKEAAIKNAAAVKKALLLVPKNTGRKSITYNYLIPGKLKSKDPQIIITKKSIVEESTNKGSSSSKPDGRVDKVSTCRSRTINCLFSRLTVLFNPLKYSNPTLPREGS